MRSFRHWTPRYIRDRISVIAWERANRDAPWLTAHAVELLDSWLQRTDHGVEWGSGRSTAWLASRCAHLMSMENDPQWHGRVVRMLEQMGVANRVDYRLCPDGMDGRPESGYVRAVDGVEEATLDFALVDGVAREHCALAAVPKLRPGGLLIIDNIEWFWPPRSPRAPGSRRQADGMLNAGWERVANLIEHWRCLWTSNGVQDTAFWIKPS